ncbi:hypothetical protein L596_008435 [Steinernema carpocapsae]|uniref:Cation/H+ exchanger transmembrane domain-containing protein n=1 Tax=Steinernema carpocapsae TaxID=34508 RepID=A0A4U5PDJ9_STECR|nr:hypothetical protein L596_008435 [Steinernema carpocapsae]
MMDTSPRRELTKCFPSAANSELTWRHRRSARGIYSNESILAMTVEYVEPTSLSEQKTPLSEESETRISIEEADETPIWKRIREEAFSVATFLLFVVLFYVGTASVLHKNPIFPFSGNNSEASAAGLPQDYSQKYVATILSVVIFLLASLASGCLVDLCKLPSLLGMLVIGIALRNIGGVSDVLFVENSVGIFIRKFAFVVILLRGGLGLDAGTLRRMKGTCLRLAFLPCTVEATVVALAAKLFLDLDFIYGFLLGFILAAVSPAVVVPGMLDIRDRGLGLKAGVSTLVTAAASIDDVYAITAFSLVLSLAMNSGDQSTWGLVLSVVRAPFEVIIGVIIGIVGGSVLCYLPPATSQRHFFRVVLLLSLASTLMFGSIALEAETVGPIAVLVAAFVVPFKWRDDLKKGETKTIEENALARMWNFCLQPLLFTLIGYQLDFSLLGRELLLSGSLVLTFGLSARIAVAYFAALGSGLNKKERLYVAFSWLPKATVQAALAPVVLDYVNQNPEKEPIRPVGTTILTIAVLSILLTAPVGAFLMRFTASKLLKKE